MNWKSRRGTSPLLSDTDEDGFTDGQEFPKGTDPLDPPSTLVIRFDAPKDGCSSSRTAGPSPLPGLALLLRRRDERVLPRKDK